MKKFIVVIWGSETVTMSFVPLTEELEKGISRDSSIAYDHAQGAELSLPEDMVEDCCKYIDGFRSLKNGHIIELEDDLKELLLSLIPEKVCGGH